MTEIKKKIIKKSLVKKISLPKKELVAKTKDEDISGEINLDKFGKDKYLETVGRRKTAIARVRFHLKKGQGFIINEKPYNQYFTTSHLQEISLAPLKKMKYEDRFSITVKVTGGGINSQAEAVRHGLSRALVLVNPENKKRLRKIGYLTRDPRQRERKKFGLKRARRAPQWGKR